MTVVVKRNQSGKKVERQGRPELLQRQGLVQGHGCTIVSQ